jgi:hypothetical protein
MDRPDLSADRGARCIVFEDLRTAAAVNLSHILLLLQAWRGVPFLQAASSAARWEKTSRRT